MKICGFLMAQEPDEALLQVGNVCAITAGHNIGRVGTITHTVSFLNYFYVFPLCLFACPYLWDIWLLPCG
jgi:hypothetical protein